MDIERLRQSSEYGNTLLKILRGEDLSLLVDYPDQSDNSIIQYVYDTLDSEMMSNDYLYNEMEDLLDAWLVEDTSASDTKDKLITLLEDYYYIG